MAATVARIGHNVLLQYCATSGGSYTTVGEVIGVKIGDITVNMLEADNVASAGRIVEMIAGMVKFDGFEVKVRYASEDTSHKALVAAVVARTKYYIKATLPQADGSAGSGSGYLFGPNRCVVSNASFGEINNGSIMEATFKFTYTGEEAVVVPS